MPELPEVETVRRGLQPALEGALVERVDLRRADLRFPFPDGFAERLEGRRIVSVGRRAKFLVIEFDRGPALIAHLGMSGSFRVEHERAEPGAPGVFHHPRSKNEAHDHAVFHLEGAGGDAVRVVFNDPRRFGFMLFASEGADSARIRHPMLDGLGLEPTGNELDGAHLGALLQGRKTPLKAALLDQTLIAGLGNIYVAEALWRAGLSPRRRAGTLSGRHGAGTVRAERLAEAVRSVIAEAVEAGGSSLRDYVRVDGSSGLFQHRFSVYDREGQPCLRPACKGVVRRIVQSGRSTFFCPHCQR